MENDKLEQAIRSIELGDKEAAMPILAQILKEDPQNDEAWIWMAAAVDDPARKKMCLKQALSINPENEDALRELSYLRSEAEPSAFIVDESEPVSLSGEMPYSSSAKAFTDEDVLTSSQAPFVDEPAEDRLRAEVFTLDEESEGGEVIDSTLSSSEVSDETEPVLFTSREASPASSRRRSRSRTQFTSNQLVILGILLLLTLIVVVAAGVYIFTNL